MGLWADFKMFLPPWFMAAVWPNLCPNSNKVLLFHQAICHIVCPYFFIFLKIWEYGSIFSIFWRNKYGIYSSLKEAEYGTARCMFIINTDHWYQWSSLLLYNNDSTQAYSAAPPLHVLHMIIWYQPNDIYHHCWVANLNLNFSFRARAFYWHWLHVCHVALYKH